MEANSFVWDPYSGVQLSIDSIQETAYKTTTKDTNYIRASTGNVMVQSIKDLPTDQIKCTWTTLDYDRERLYEYISGRDVIFGYGAKHRVSFVKMKATFCDTPSTVQHGVLDIVYTGIIRGYLTGCEDPTGCESNVAPVVDTAAFNNSSVKLTKKNDTVHFEQKSLFFPEAGNYLFFIRASDVTHIANDLNMYISDLTTNTVVANQTSTMTAAYGFYWLTCTISATQATHPLSFACYKVTNSTNSISCDCMGYVALP